MNGDLSEYFEAEERFQEDEADIWNMVYEECERHPAEDIVESPPDSWLSYSPDARAVIERSAADYTGCVALYSRILLRVVDKYWDGWDIYTLSAVNGIFREAFLGVRDNVLLLLGAVASYGNKGARLDAGKFRAGGLMDLTPGQLRDLLPAEVTKQLTRTAAAIAEARKTKPLQVDASPLRHAGGTVYPRENTPAAEHAGRQFSIQCQEDRFTVVKGKGNRPQDRITYTVPPALRAFVDDLLTAYETGAWTPPPDLGTDPKGKPRKWRQYAPPALLGIIQPEPNGKNGYTGNSRLWIE